MKIDKQKLKQIIKEEIESVLEQETEKAFGTTSVGKSDLATSLKTQAKNLGAQSGIDGIERGIIDRITKDLEKLASVQNLKSGSTFGYLKKLVAALEKEIQNASAGQQKKEN